MILRIDLNNSDISSILQAVRVLKENGIIAYPTETFYGLGVDALNEELVKNLYRLKGRDFNKPIPILIRDLNMLNDLVVDIPNIAYHLVEEFWPGPLTIIFKSSKKLPKILTAETGTVGIRISSSILTKRLFDYFDSPITTTSANPSGKPPALSKNEVYRYFKDQINLILDAGRLRKGLGSTVVDVTSGEIRILREGKIKREDIYGKHFSI